MSRLIAVTSLLCLVLPTASLAQNATVETDVIYGFTQGSALLADIAYPEQGEDLPAIIYVHGGRWRAGERTGRDRLKVDQWAGFGYFAMTIDYRLVLASPAPAPQQDLLCAIRWLHAHADEYNVDPDRIYLIGNSAGGHMVSLAVTLGDGPYEKVGGWDDARSDVRAVISVAAPYELNPLSWGNLWTPIEGDVEEARRIASPIHQINAATKPILVIHSDDDRSVPVQQAHDMVAALKAANIKHRFVHYTDRGHMRITDEVIAETRAFIAEVEGR